MTKYMAPALSGGRVGTGSRRCLRRVSDRYYGVSGGECRIA